MTRTAYAIALAAIACFLAINLYRGITEGDWNW
jgi:hypothetical protein